MASAESAGTTNQTHDLPVANAASAHAGAEPSRPYQNPIGQDAPPSCPAAAMQPRRSFLCSLPAIWQAVRPRAANGPATCSSLSERDLVIFNDCLASPPPPA